MTHVNKNVRSRAWIFTINNYTSNDHDQVAALAQESRYLIAGKEVGEEGTPHYQGYVFFDNARSRGSLSKRLTRAWLSPAKGSPQENYNYCSKQEILIQHGTLPVMGKRTDIDVVRDMIQEGARMREVVATATSYQSIKVAEIYLKYHEPERDWKPQVRWYHGSTGSGKTRAAREWLNEDIYTTLNDAKWFEGYDAHENVLIDDFRKDFCKFHVLLKMLDRYSHRVETKGGSRQFLPKKIAITAPYPPDKVYDTREDVQQLLRRIDEIIQVGELVEHLEYDPIEKEYLDIC